MSLADTWVDATASALAPLADAPKAAEMRRYMKDVSPFLGIQTPARRAAQRAAWKPLPAPDPAEVATIARDLWALPEREYQYAACDLLARTARMLPGEFVVDPVEGFIGDRPWWDTIDSLGSSAITPLVAAHPEQIDTMWQWWDTGDRWLVRAAIQHQRGRKEDTDLDILFAMCDRYAEDREFFIAKAIGWALRDVTRWDPSAVRMFVDEHPGLSTVARREAVKGLSRPSPP